MRGEKHEKKFSQSGKAFLVGKASFHRKIINYTVEIHDEKNMRKGREKVFSVGKSISRR